MGKASSLFNGAGAHTLINRVSPTASQREFLQECWNELANYLKATLKAKYDYNISTWLQGSYKYGTLIKPMRPDEAYDVDVGVYFEWGQGEDIEPSPQQLRTWVQAELKLYEGQCEHLKSVSEPKERCSRVSYKRQFHIDTPVYHLNRDTNVRRLACLNKGWEASDPKAFYQWFKNAVTGDDREQLRRLIRYLKSWAAVSFEDVSDSRPTSIFLTVLATEAYLEFDLFTRLMGQDDDDALIAVIKSIHARLVEDRRVMNPASKTPEDINRMNEDAWHGFLPRLDALLDVAVRADEAADEAAAALIWSEAFSFLMPLPEALGVEIVDHDSGRALMQLPEIDIKVFAPNKKGLVARHRNEVPGVAKGCKLEFTIANPHVIPQYGIVEWTVRNKGSEADYHSDLGHRTIGMRMAMNRESTAYVGTHFMDCIVRLNGHVYAVRRVPVTIRDIQPIARNPARPQYVKLLSRRARRR